MAAKSPQGFKSAEELHQYWVAGPGLAKWLHSPHPWTALYNHLAKYIVGDTVKLKTTTSKWHNELLPSTGHDSYRLAHGGKIRGKKIGSG